ncbi:MAG: hypothetical protein WCR42_07440 [bacterium]
MIFAFLGACNQTEKTKKMPTLSFNSKVVEINKPVFYHNSAVYAVRKYNYCLKLSNFDMYDGENIFSYSWKKKYHYLQETDLEIVFTRERLSKPFVVKPENCLIGGKFINKNLRAFFICWQNKPIRLKKDERNYFEWEISEMTDSLFTNLSKEQIKELFPKFKGNYSYRKVDSIYIYYDDSMINCKFFNTIKFKNYQLGLEKMVFRFIH